MTTLQEDLLAVQRELAQAVTANQAPVVAPETTPVAQSQEPVVTPSPAPVVEPAPQAVATPPAVAEPATVVTPEVALNIDDWDKATVAQTPANTPPAFDFSALGKTVGVEVKTQEDFVAQFKALQEEVSKAKQTAEALQSNVPQDLQKAIELARAGGDYIGYLGIGAQDYAKADPIELYEKFVETSLTDPKTGVTDWDKVNAHLDKLDDAELDIRGRQVQLQYVQYQNEQRSKKEQEIMNQRRSQELAIRQAVDSLEKVGDFKLSSTHKQEVFNDLLVDPLGDYRRRDGSFDYAKLARDRFIIRNYDKLDSFRQQQIKNATTRNVIKDISNPELTRPAALPAPEPKRGFSQDDVLSWVTKVK